MVALASGVFLLAVICAGLMGYAIQRGATCTVAAVGEIVEQGTTKRLIALLEAALWVAGGIAVASTAGVLPMLPAGFALSGWTVLGGVLLGLGAYINGACLFGALARLGSGDWAYVLAPLGFYVGLISFTPLFHMEVSHSIPTMVPQVAKPFATGFAALFVGYALWRLWKIFSRTSAQEPALRRIWMPHEATILIGVTFVILLTTVGAWTYTDLLFDISQHKVRGVEWRSLLFAALFAGAVVGGLTAGRFKLLSFRATALVRCFAGGTLMGWGGALTPGGNDWLILVGLPLFWPYAWVSVIAMCGTIYAALQIERGLKPSV